MIPINKHMVTYCVIGIIILVVFYFIIKYQFEKIFDAKLEKTKKKIVKQIYELYKKYNTVDQDENTMMIAQRERERERIRNDPGMMVANGGMDRGDRDRDRDRDREDRGDRGDRGDRDRDRGDRDRGDRDRDRGDRDRGMRERDIESDDDSIQNIGFNPTGNNNNGDFATFE